MKARAVLIGLFVLVSFSASGAATPSPQPSNRAHTAVTVVGTIRTVQFRQSNALVTVTNGGNTTEVLVTPGTLIQAGASSAPRANFIGGGSQRLVNGYRTMTDLKPGTPVQIYTTQSAGKLTASILILQK